MRVAFSIINKLNERKYNTFLFAFFLMAIFFISIFVRHQQLKIWDKNPTVFFVNEAPMMTTLDAPYWIGLAKSLNNGNYYKKDELRNYPDGKYILKKKHDKNASIPLEFKDKNKNSPIQSTLLSQKKHETKYNKIPLLSLLISKIVKLFNFNYFLTGTMMVPTFASMFIIPLGIYFFKIGIPLSGLLGGLIGTFSSGYYVRSSIGRIDTDMLNLFFPIFISLMILMAAKSKTEREVLLFSIGAGLSMFLFNWWYNREGFTFLFFVVLVFSLFLHKIRLRTILLSTFLFLLCAHPKSFLNSIDSVESFINTYFFIVETTSSYSSLETFSPAKFPNVLKTITEAENINLDEVLVRIISTSLIAWIGFISFLILAIFRWKVFLPLAPLIILGIFSFISSNRFIMYLAPLIGIGLGWIITFCIECFISIFERFTKKEQKHLDPKANKLIDPEVNKLQLNNKNKIEIFELLKQIFFYLGLMTFFWTISSKTAISFVPFPSINTNVYKTFFEIKKIVPKDSALLSWWDYGYAISEATNLATFHDGGSQFNPKTYFIARSFVSHDQKELFDITQYLATEGNKGIRKNNTSPKALMKAVLNPINKPWDPIYIFFTADMTRKFGAISRIGSWDIDKGGSNQKGYHFLNCNKINNEVMQCRGAIIDLKKGKINNNNNLKRIIFIRDGKVIREKSFDNNEGFTLQMVVFENRIVEVQLIEEDVFNSNYNQMFLLGRYRKDLFEEKFNSYPFSRLYKIKY